MVRFWNEGFEGSAWMVYLIFLVVIGTTCKPYYFSISPRAIPNLCIVLPLYYTPRLIPLITTMSLWLSLIGFAVNFLVLVSMKKHNNPWSYITEPHLGTSGWGEGTAWVLGSINSMLVTLTFFE